MYLGMDFRNSFREDTQTLSTGDRNFRACNFQAWQVTFRSYLPWWRTTFWGEFQALVTLLLGVFQALVTLRVISITKTPIKFTILILAFNMYFS